MISSVRSSSLGNYSCLAKNKFGSDSVQLTVVDERKIIVREPPQYSVVGSGQTVRLRCSGQTGLGRVRYTWWKGNTPVQEVGLLQARAEVTRDGSTSILEIRDVHRDDAGVYLCQLSNEEGQEEEEVEAEVSVLEEAARVVFTPRQVHLVLGQAGTVPCHIRPSFYLATWTRPVFFTLIGRGPTRLGSHWSRASEFFFREQCFCIKNQLVASKASSYGGGPR